MTFECDLICKCLQYLGHGQLGFFGFRCANETSDHFGIYERILLLGKVPILRHSRIATLYTCCIINMFLTYFNLLLLSGSYLNNNRRDKYLMCFTCENFSWKFSNSSSSQVLHAGSGTSHSVRSLIMNSLTLSMNSVKTIMFNSLLLTAAMADI